MWTWGLDNYYYSPTAERVLLPFGDSQGDRDYFMLLLDTD